MREYVCETLADLIMQFTADALALFLLHVQNPECFLLPTNHTLTLFDETDSNGVCNAICGGFVGIEHAVEKGKIPAVLLEKRSGQDIAQQENNPKHLVCFDASVNDAAGQVSGVGLQIPDAAGPQRPHVVVVEGSR